MQKSLLLDKGNIITRCIRTWWSNEVGGAKGAYDCERFSTVPGEHESTRGEL